MNNDIEKDINPAVTRSETEPLVTPIKKSGKAGRLRHFTHARDTLTLSRIGQTAEQQEKQVHAVTAEPVVTQPHSMQNRIESNELFTARQSDVTSIVPTDIEKDYRRVGNTFYHSTNTDWVAFEDKGNQLDTHSNSETIAQSMVRIAQARGWDEIKVSGSERFCKEVWLIAASRGMHVKGYLPTEPDKAELAKQLREVDVQQDSRAKIQEMPSFHVEHSHVSVIASTAAKMAEAFTTASPADAVRHYPELASAVAAAVAMEKKAEADDLTTEQQAIVAARIRQNIANSIKRGKIPEIRLKEPVEVKQEIEEEQEYTR